MSTPTVPTAESTAELSGLAVELTGTLAVPGEPGYELASPWNVAIPVAPLAVIAAADAQDVVTAVRWAGEHGLRVAVQRTGHGAVPLSGDVLLVHTGRLDELAVDPRTRCARIGAGVLWQQVVDAAAPHGLTPLAGSSTTVGVVGFLTGGGIGPLTRTFGLASDRVLAFEVVTGDGRLLRATPDEHADLFWGLRGGKATLGIVTAVEIELIALREVIGGALYFDGEHAAAVLERWSTWAPALPEHANTSLALLQLPPMPAVPPPLAGRLTVAVRFASTEDAATCEELLSPMRTAAPALIDTIGPLPVTDIAAIHADPVDPMPTHEASGLLHGLPADAVEALLAVAGAGSASPQLVVELRLLGGAYARHPRHTSAFCHREAAFSLLVIGAMVPPIADAVPSHAASVITAMGPWSTGAELPNFGASTDPERSRRAYDEPTRLWLSALADQHDPARVLSVGQVVRGA